MSIYTKPVIRFGVITPLLFNCVLLAGEVAAIFKLMDIKAEKEARYAEQVARVAATKKLEAEIAPKKVNFSNQKSLLAADSSQIFTRLLDTTLPKYEDVELERTGLVFPLDRGKVGRVIKTDLARVKSTFEGGIGPMQETMLQVEALMPQAMLEELKISRKPADTLLNKPEHLTFELTHSCWKAGGVTP